MSLSATRLSTHFPLLFHLSTHPSITNLSIYSSRNKPILLPSVLNPSGPSDFSPGGFQPWRGEQQTENPACQFHLESVRTWRWDHEADISWKLWGWNGQFCIAPGCLGGRESEPLGPWVGKNTGGWRKLPRARGSSIKAGRQAVNV